MDSYQDSLDTARQLLEQLGELWHEVVGSLLLQEVNWHLEPDRLQGVLHLVAAAAETVQLAALLLRPFTPGTPKPPSSTD